MTSQVDIAGSASSPGDTNELPRADIVGGGSILVLGNDVGAVLECARQIEPAPRLATATASMLPEELRTLHDTVLMVCGPPSGKVSRELGLVVQAAGTIPVVVVCDAACEERRRVVKLLRSQGATEVVLAADLQPLLLETVVGHAREKADLKAEVMSMRDRFALAVRGALDGMWEYELAGGQVYLSQRWLELLDLERGGIGDRLDDWLSRIHPGDVPGFENGLAAHIEGHVPVFQCEHRIRTAGGDYRWMLVRGVAQRDKQGAAVRVSGSMTDITKYRVRAEEVRAQSRHDGITDLPKQQVFHERLARAVEIRRSYTDYGFAVLLVHVDRFGLLRGSFGKESADVLLGQVAERIQACVTSDDVLCRYGDDRFAILLEDLEDPTAGTAVADRIHQAIDEPFDVHEQQVHLTVSIGMTSSARDYASVDHLITDVSAATDHASEARKRGARGQEVFKTNMRIEALTLLRLEMGLREALERGEFQLHYQPLVDIGSRQLHGFEALIRWNSPTQGPVSPGQFIPVAESTGLIVPIGRWALFEAARQLRSWHDDFEVHGKLAVNVNLSGRQVKDAALLTTLDEALSDTGVDPTCLRLELTESVLMENSDFAIDLIQQLRSRGVQIYVDDFGTGYSSLSYLHRFPVDGLKIDKSFVDELTGDLQSGVMIKTILEMAHNLGLDVVAEGIEEPKQVEQLRLLGCRKGQGYFFGKPMSPGDAYAAIARAFP